MAVDVEPIAATDVAGLPKPLVAVYRATFPPPPSTENEADVASFAKRLPRHAARDGFRCAVGREGDRPIGFAYGYVGAPGPWRHDRVRAALSPPMVERWLDGAFELTELAVVPNAQGRGIGSRLHDAVLDATSAPPVVASTPRDDDPAVAFYRRRGWATLIEDMRYPGAPTPRLLLGRRLGSNNERSVR